MCRPGFPPKRARAGVPHAPSESRPAHDTEPKTKSKTMFSTAFAKLRSTVSRLPGGLRGALLALAALSTVAAEAAAPAPGTMISNQAEATYNLTDEVARNLLSNKVDAQIAAMHGISLEPDRQVQSAPGAEVSFAHVLRNLGGSAVQVTLEYAIQLGSGFELTDLRLIRDLNGNGAADPGEPDIAQGEILDLDAGEGIPLVLLGRVPASVSPGSIARADVLATSTVGDSAKATDTVTLQPLVPQPTPPPERPLPPDVTKTTSRTEAKPGDTIDFGLNLFTGSSWRLMEIRVDGQPTYATVLRDPLPAQVELVGVSGEGSQVLYQTAGMPANEYLGAPPADLGQVTTVAFAFFGEMIKQSRSYTLQVRVREGTTGTITNIAYYDGINQFGVPSSTPSNPVTVNLPGPQPPSLTKTASVAESVPGGVVTYTLNLFTGNAWRPATVTVDGESRELIVVHDPIPANSRFAGVVQSAGAQVLYQVYGGGGYQSAPPSDLAQVSAIAFGFASLPSGASLTMSFDVKMSDIADGLVRNVGYVNGKDPGGNPTTTPSNPVNVTVDGDPARLEFRDPPLDHPLPVSGSNIPLNLIAFAAACNTDAGVAESYGVFLSSRISEDEEGPLTITETGPNTGIFAVRGIPTERWPEAAQVDRDGTMQLAINDTVDARMQCGGQEIGTSILIDPTSVVFDSATGKAVEGARVTVYLVMPDGSLKPAEVRGYDGKPLPNWVITGPDGLYSFPMLPPGTYKYVVEPPNGYRFASQVPPAQQPPGRTLGDGSFGDLFVIAGLNPVQDIPVDPVAMDGLALEKTGSRDNVEVGETLQYTLTLHNETGRIVRDVVIEDRLPIGFTYLPGSARLDKQPLDDPQGLPGSRLVFDIGTIEADAAVTLTYVVRVGTGALKGDGINVAQARSPRGESNIARFTVEVEPGVFSDEAFVVGKVFVDCNRDDLQGDEEPGIPGVRLYMDDGTFAITDVEGKYSLYGLSPRTHVLKLDRITLPAGAEMATLSNRNAGDPQSRFVDLKKGELHRADFAEGSCTPAILQQIKQRRAAGEVAAAKINDDKSFVDPLKIDDGVQRTDRRALPASGTISADGKIVAEAPMMPKLQGQAQVSPLPVSGSSAVQAVATTVDLQKLLPELKDNRFGFMDLKDGDTLAGTDLTVRLQGRDGAAFRLLANDTEVPDSRIGQKARMPTRQVQAWEYVAIKLNPGVNRLRAEALDGFGNVRDKVEISVTAPGKPGKLSFVLPPDGAVADGQTPARIMVRLRDADGVVVTARTLITLEASSGHWDVADFDPSRPGVQTFIEGGEALFDLVPPAEPGNADLRVSSGILEATSRLPLNPFLRPLIASGLIEGAVGFSHIDGDALAPVSAEDGFEKDIERINGAGDDHAVGVRGSMFLKGKVKGDYLLTLAYDSDKDTRDRLFRDIEPEHFYPIYGDASIKGFDAQSTSPLYVRIDKGRSYLLYGDFNTSIASEQRQAQQLTTYSRSLTGVQQHIETGPVIVNLFASRDSRRQQINEFRAEGISGPYRLPGKGFLRNSEKVEIVTRDRNQSSLILSVQPMTRFVDYTIDELDGTIMFTRPIAGVDANLNPVFVRVTWEIDTGGESFWVYGADGRYRLTKWLEVGASVVRENDPSGTRSLYGVNATLDVAENSAVTVEVARSETELQPGGQAWRAEWARRELGNETKLYVAESDAEFDNPSAVIQAGRREAGVIGSLRLTERLRATAKGIYSESTGEVPSAAGESAASVVQPDRRQGIFAGIDYALTPQLSVGTGVRYTQDDNRQAGAGGADDGEAVDREVTSLNASATWAPQALPSAKLNLEYEQDVDAADNRMLAVGGDYQLGQRSRVYARHELISSPTGPFGLTELSKDQNSTVFGVDYDYMENANAFSEYRVRDAISGAEAQAAVGLRNGWDIKPGLKMTTQLERVHAVEGLARENTAVAVGLSYTGDPLTRAGTRLEWRQGSSETSVLNTVAVARKLSLDWSFLGKNTISVVERDSDESSLIRDRLRLGLAWRQTDSNRWSWLGRYELRYDRNDKDEVRRYAHTVSNHVNFQPNRDWVLSGRHALKYVDDDSYGQSDNYIGQLLSGRATYDISERWDAGVVVSTLFDRGSQQYGVGGELGYLVTSNLWLSAGYNFSGYADEDFEDVDYTRQGAYVRLRLKFDEEWLRWLE